LMSYLVVSAALLTTGIQGACATTAAAADKSKSAGSAIKVVVADHLPTQVSKRKSEAHGLLFPPPLYTSTLQHIPCHR